MDRGEEERSNYGKGKVRRRGKEKRAEKGREAGEAREHQMRR